MWLSIFVLTLLLPLAAPTDAWARNRAEPAIENPATSAQTFGGTTVKATEIDAFLKAAMVRHKVQGLQFALFKGGRMTYQTSQGIADVTNGLPVVTASLFEAASLSKPLFGLFAMTFVEAGQLDLDKPLGDYLSTDDLGKDVRFSQITARMVLTHSSGLPNWRRDQPEGLALAFDPGKGFRYSGEGYEYLARVLAHIAKTDNAGLEFLYLKRVARPLGLKSTRFFPTAKELRRRAMPHEDGKRVEFEKRLDHFGAAFGVHSSASDYALFAMAVAAQKKVLKPANWAVYLAPQSIPIPAENEQRQFGLTDWALGFSVYETPAGRFYVHSGNNVGFTSLVVIEPKTGQGLTVFTNANQANLFLIELFGFIAR